MTEAIKSRKLEFVKYLVEHVPDVNARAVGSSKTLFNEAILRLEPEMIEFFINHGADVNAGETIEEKPLALAIYIGNVDKIVLLIKHGAIADCEMLTYAIQHSGRGRSRSKSFSYSTEHSDMTLEVVKVLLDNGAYSKKNAHIHRPLNTAFHRLGGRDLARLLVQRGARFADEHVDINGLLLKHLEWRNWAQVNFLLENGANTAPVITTLKESCTDIYELIRDNELKLFKLFLDNSLSVLSYSTTNDFLQVAFNNERFNFLYEMFFRGIEEVPDHSGEYKITEAVIEHYGFHPKEGGFTLQAFSGYAIRGTIKSKNNNTQEHIKAIKQLPVPKPIIEYIIGLPPRFPAINDYSY